MALITSLLDYLIVPLFVALISLGLLVSIYSKTTHYKNFITSEVREKRRQERRREKRIIKMEKWARKRQVKIDAAKKIRAREKPLSKIALAGEIKAAVDQIKALALPSALGNLTSERPITPTESRLGGPVFLPDSISYPLDTSGNPMLFLIQINFEQIPNIPGYPKAGILQFFTQADEMLGKDSAEHGSKNRQVFFWTDTQTLKSRHDPIEVHPDILLYKQDWIDRKMDATTARDIHQNGRKIEFKSTLSDIIPWIIYDYPIPKLLGDDFKKHPYLDEHVEEQIEGINPKAQIMIGGYPCFHQGDPRLHSSQDTEYSRVLLMIGSMKEIQVWDNGALNILVRPEDLKNHDFSNIIYDIN